jgi:hypothetical protein
MQGGPAHHEGQLAGTEKTPANKALPSPGILSLDGMEVRVTQIIILVQP